MYLKNAVTFLFLAIICSAGFARAFNSDRLQNEESKIQKSEIVHEERTDIPGQKSLNHQRNHHENGNHKNVTPDHHVESHKKGVKVLKRRHVRNRRDRYPDLPADILEIFSPNQETKVKRNISPNDYFSSLNNQQQQPWRSSAYPVYSPYANPSVYHNTVVPNGPQVNNYIGYYSGTGQTSWPQQVVPPWSSSNTPLVIYIPYYIYIPYTPAPYPAVPSTNPTITVDDRFSFPQEEGTGVAQRPNTTTGISLEIATPPRRPSRPLPPIQRPPSNLGAPGQNNIIPQESRPPATQRPSPIPEESFIIAQAPSVGPNVSPCIRAIVSCCQSNNGSQRLQERCFEVVGCPGAFYDTNPCSGQLATAAQQLFLGQRAA